MLTATWRVAHRKQQNKKGDIIPSNTSPNVNVLMQRDRE